MSNVIAAEIRNAAQFMAVDELGRLWICGDGIKNADNMRDFDRLLELGVVTYDGAGCYHVAEGYTYLFKRL